jgi:hypothetical protein
MKICKQKKPDSSANEFFKGVAFCTGREGPKLYVNTIDCLGLYASTQFKNDSDVMKCLNDEGIVKPEVPELSDNHTAHEKIIWEYHIGELIKTERVKREPVQSDVTM